MSYGLVGAFVLFAVVTLFTPGPNNVMLMTSGLNFGLRRAQPHVLGVTLGFSFMVLVVGLGLGAVFSAWPALYTIIKYAGAAYLVYLAVMIAMSGPPKPGETSRGPLTFWGAAMFQWVNVKGWVFVIGTITAYADVASFPWNIVIQTAVCLLLGVLACGAWTLLGSSLRPLLTSPAAVRVFNLVMAALLLASLYPVFMDA